MSREPEAPNSSTASPAAPADEVDWLNRISAGDAVAFRSIVDRYLPHLLAIGRRMLRDDAEAEDVAQDALLRLWRIGSKLELGPGGLKPRVIQFTT